MYQIAILCEHSYNSTNQLINRSTYFSPLIQLAI